MKKHLLLFSTIVYALSVWAETIQVQGIYYNILNSNQVEVTYLNSWDVSHYPGLKSLTLPDSILHNATYYQVVGIGSNAFRSCDSLQSVVLPSTLRYIGDEAFYNCSLLDSVLIPRSVDSIGVRIFAKCVSLTSLSVAEGNTRYDSRNSSNVIVETASNTLIAGCQTSVIPRSIEHIADWAFWGCNHLNSLNIPSNVQSIGNNSFLDCDSITSILWNAKDYPDVLTEENSPFENIKQQITSFVIGDSVAHVINYLCYGMSNLQTVTIGKEVLSFGEYTFYSCPSLTSIVWNAKHCLDFALKSTDYPYNAFYILCDQIESIVFGEEVEHIPRLLCYNMWMLSSIVIYNNVKTIGSYAFKRTNRIDVTLYANSVDEFLFNNLNFKFEEAKMAYRDVHLFIDSILVTEIVVPNTITSINDYAFSDCVDLISISLPRTVKSIGAAAFEKCKKLQSIIIPDGLTSIGDAAFEDCEMLKSITIPENVTSIGTKAFLGCDSLSICWNAKKCSSNQLGFGVKSCIFGDSVEYIPPKLLQGINSLVSVTLPKGLTVIEDKFFQNCTSLSSVTIPNSVLEIGSYAFKNCTSLTSITIPSSVLTIGLYAFDGCNFHSITYETTDMQLIDRPNFCDSVVLKEGITYIPYELCNRIWNLTSVSIPKSVTGIQYNAFYRTKLYNDTSRWENGVLYIDDCLIAAKPSLSGHYNIKEGTRLIADGAFGYCTNLTSITIPNSVKYIGHNVFYSSGILANNDYWHQGALYIDNCLIKTNSDLPKNYVIPSYTRVIASGAFEGRYYLASVSIPSTITHIGNNTFAGCGSLQRIILPEGITSIGKETFSECSSLKSVYIPQSVVSIGNKAFSKCSSLEHVCIPSSVTSIGKSAFAECTSLSSIDFSDNLRSIGEWCFYNCSSLLSINLPSTLRSIGDLAFAGCKSVNYLNIGDSLQYIGFSAFYGCKSLRSVTLPSTLEKAEKNLSGEDVFSSCTYLEAIFVPKGEKKRFVDMGFKKSLLVEQTGRWNTIHFQYGGLNYKINKRTEYQYDFDKRTEKKYTYWDTTTVCVIPEYNNYSTLKNYDGLTHISIPDYVTHNGITYRVTGIGSEAFKNCASLVAIKLPSHLQFVESSAFAGCTALTSISLPNSVEKIGCSAFENCQSLSSFVVPNGVSEIGSRMLLGCSSLSHLTLGEGLINVFSSAFANCKSLTSITIPKRVYFIDAEVFKYCTSLKDIYILNPDVTLNSDVFYGARMVTVYYNGTQQQWSEIAKNLNYLPDDVVCLVL